MSRHTYNGRCPDTIQPHAPGDPLCPVCFPAATGVPCPTCGAARGQNCTRLTGTPGRALPPHAARVRALATLADAEDPTDA